jgi:hypothetical protein
MEKPDPAMITATHDPDVIRRALWHATEAAKEMGISLYDQDWINRRAQAYEAFMNGASLAQTAPLFSDRR